MSRAPRNVAISVRDRLVQLARDRRENAQLLMARYVIERLLYRLSLSPHRDRFILKGAMLFSLWADAPYRATGDLDLLGAGDNTPQELASVFREILAVEVADDGIVFRPETLRAVAARAEDEYAGVRIDFVAELAGARLRCMSTSAMVTRSRRLPSRSAIRRCSTSRRPSCAPIPQRRWWPRSSRQAYFRHPHQWQAAYLRLALRYYGLQFSDLLEPYAARDWRAADI